MAPTTSSSSQVTPSLEGLKNEIEKAQRLMGSLEVTNEDVKKLYEEMHQQDTLHKQAMEEIEGLLNHIYDKKIYEGLEEEIKVEMEGHIDAIVQRRVEEELKKYIPEGQRQQIADVNKELEQVRIDLHNSESRLFNALLSSENSNKNLNTIKMSNGQVSASFPKTLGGLLFGLDEGALEQLRVDYEFCPPTDSVLIRRNKFVHFCGVRYQMVARDP